MEEGLEHTLGLSRAGDLPRHLLIREPFDTLLIDRPIQSFGYAPRLER